MYNRINKKKTLIVSLVLILCVAIGGTIMYLTDYSNEVVNTFTPAQVTSAVVEDLDGDTKKDVKIKNTGNTDAYIRAAIVVTWKDEQGNILGEDKPILGEDYIMSTTEVLNPIEEPHWFIGKDGYYYWSNTVAPNEATGALISSCQYTSGAPAGYQLTVEILGSAIQSRGVLEDNTPIVEIAWPAVKVVDGKLVANN